MKRPQPATVIAGIIFILALLLGMAGRALWIERDHHRSAHVPPTASDRPPP